MGIRLMASVGASGVESNTAFRGSGGKSCLSLTRVMMRPLGPLLQPEYNVGFWIVVSKKAFD